MNAAKQSLMQRFNDDFSRRYWRWGLFLLLGALDLLWWGYSYGNTNHCVQIPILKSYFDAALYPNDLMVAVGSRYVTVYYLIVAAINQIVGDLEWLLFCMHLCAFALILAATYHLATVLFRQRAPAILATLLMATKMYDLQLGGVIHRAMHTHTVAAFPLALWAIARFLQGRTRSAYIILGLTFNINAQSASYVCAMFALTSLVRWRQHGWRKTVTDWGVFLLCASPCLVWIAVTSTGPLTKEVLELLRIRSAFHSFPGTWPAAQNLMYLLLVSCGVLLWSRALRIDGPLAAHRALGWFGVAAAFLWLAGTVFTEIYPLKIVIRAQLFRSTAFFTLFVVLYASYAATTLWRAGAAGKALAAGIFIVFVSPEYRSFLPLLLLGLVLLEGRDLKPWALIPLLGAVVWQLHSPALHLPATFDPRHLFGVFTPLVAKQTQLLLLCAVLCWAGIRALLAGWSRNIVLGIATLPILFYVLPQAYDEATTPGRAPSAWIDVQTWARDQTPKDAVFITPPAIDGFRVYSERSTVVEWKDGTLQFFDDSFSLKWWKRIQELGRYQHQYNGMSQRKVQVLAQKYGAKYAVFQKTKRFSFKVAYENPEFRVYELPPPAKPPRAPKKVPPRSQPAKTPVAPKKVPPRSQPAKTPVAPKKVTPGSPPARPLPERPLVPAKRVSPAALVTPPKPSSKRVLRSAPALSPSPSANKQQRRQ